MTDDIVVSEERLKAEGVGFVALANSISITGPDKYDEAAKFRISVKASDKKAEAFFKPMKQAADLAKQRILDAEKAVREQFKVAVEITDRKLIEWTTEQDRLREEAERKAREEALKQEQDARLAEAAHLEKMGEVEEAEALVNAPVEMPPVSIERTVPKVAGLSTRENWSATVTDLGKLVAYVAANPQFLNLLVPNTVALNQLARAQKQLLAIPGVKAMATTSVASRQR